ncbi:MAG: HutD-family protein [Rhodospirillaceae bacterium]|nr:HutD-family protein [Rhodospirillaceae bacterium]MBB59264.1 HutD-family protein [Rhodospirillaceae bacterium]|tara:strand:+ start:56 stop:607 length:552 start_codon:yes stop_codon:yes gene_type:complete
MKIFKAQDYKETPWKNGGGITREIALKEDEDGFLWRLSIADVRTDGPFSSFPDRHRILTVIAGVGMRLKDRRTGAVIEALPQRPIDFRGDQEINSELLAGPIQDFNVMFDPLRVKAEVRVLRDDTALSPPEGLNAVYCLSGAGKLDQQEIRAGETAIWDTGPGLALAVPGDTAILSIHLAIVE